MTAIAGPGMAFLGWCGDWVSSSNRASLTMDGHKHVVAAFEGSSGLVIECNQESLEKALEEGGTVRFGNDGTIVLTDTLEVRKDLILDGLGHEVTISGDGQVRLFYVHPGITCQIKKLTLANGRYKGRVGSDTEAGEPAYGGAIYNESGAVYLTDCVLTNHGAQGGEGGGTLVAGIFYPKTKGGDAYGGAIFSLNSKVVLESDLFEGNEATSAVSKSEGGALYLGSGQSLIRGSRFSNNTCNGGVQYGGMGMYSSGRFLWSMPRRCNI